jgi:hypothetical protein
MGVTPVEAGSGSEPALVPQFYDWDYPMPPAMRAGGKGHRAGLFFEEESTRQRRGSSA